MFKRGRGYRSPRQYQPGAFSSLTPNGRRFPPTSEARQAARDARVERVMLMTQHEWQDRPELEAAIRAKLSSELPTEEAWCLDPIGL